MPTTITALTPVDLDPINAALIALTGRVDELTARVDALTTVPDPRVLLGYGFPVTANILPPNLPPGYIGPRFNWAGMKTLGLNTAMWWPGSITELEFAKSLGIKVIVDGVWAHGQYSASRSTSVSPTLDMLATRPDLWSSIAAFLLHDEPDVQDAERPSAFVMASRNAAVHTALPGVPTLIVFGRPWQNTPQPQTSWVASDYLPHCDWVGCDRYLYSSTNPTQAMLDTVADAQRVVNVAGGRPVLFILPISPQQGRPQPTSQWLRDTGRAILQVGGIQHLGGYSADLGLPQTLLDAFPGITDVWAKA